MTALPLSRNASVALERRRAHFEQRLEGYATECEEAWLESPVEPPCLGRRISRLRQLWTERETRRLIDETAQRVTEHPRDELAREEWRSQLQERVRRFGEERFDWPQGYRRLLLADAFWHATVDFCRSAKRFAPSIRPEDLFQALRNVWIMNSAQMLLDLRVESTPEVFAYSMLYPWTDNYLDDPEVSSGQKSEFNRRLGRRLAGEPVSPSTRHEAEVHDLLGLIESSIDRRIHPEVYFSLQAIHRAQTDSLRQHASGLGRRALLALSVRKGGASVLPDAYLVARRLEREEERFMFGYGVFLQFLDDLQDVATDRQAGHHTLFTREAEAGPLDRHVARLHAFIRHCLDRSPRFEGSVFEARKDLIRRNCIALLVGAVADQPRLFSRGFRRTLERRWPLSFAGIRRLRRYARKRFSLLKPKLEERFGTDSVLDLVTRDG